MQITLDKIQFETKHPVDTEGTNFIATFPFAFIKATPMKEAIWAVNRIDKTEWDDKLKKEAFDAIKEAVDKELA